ncbi:tail fiber protein [Brevibacillus borstelensis AK1]|uniref:Tail fiber protein n=1 Tax=Brevibacillus borstelensis AK1 TaxID=1300222 RepID=M8DM53_9BACL|nr:hypothetical protein [Brevibacillus borstelensis]EMT54703.1 tail fiber protein [Brevibacillus borstelensis AK1]
MPNLTPRLGLKKPLPTEVADITVINENYDKIDELAMAANIKLADKDNLFKATDVEGGMKELFTYADSGKKSIVTVIGPPALLSDTFAQLTQKIQNAKDQLATNLVGKGQSASGSESLSSLVDKVANISTDYKMIEGSFKGANGDTFPSVTGLPAKPKLVWLERYLSGTTTRGPDVSAPIYGISGGILITNDGFKVIDSYKISYPGSAWKVLY